MVVKWEVLCSLNFPFHALVQLYHIAIITIFYSTFVVTVMDVSQNGYSFTVYGICPARGL